MTNKIDSDATVDRKALYSRLLQVASQPHEEDDEHLTTEKIFDYAFERLPLDAVKRIDGHLDSDCDVCQDDMERVFEVVSPWVGEISVTPDILASLKDRLSDPTWNVRLSAAATIAAIGPAAAAADILSGLLNMIQDERAWIRDGAVEAFNELGRAADTPRVQHILNELLGHSDSGIRLSALEVGRGISKFSDQPRRGILRYRATADRLADLALRLSSAEDLECEAAVQVIAALGGAAAELGFVLSLVRLMSQAESEETRDAAAQSLSAIGPAAAWPEVLSACANALRSQNADVGDTITQAIEDLGPVAMTGPIVEAIGVLVGSPESSTTTVRQVFYRYLSALSPTAKITTAGVRARIDEILERVSAEVRVSIAPMPLHFADGGNQFYQGALGQGRIRYRMQWDRDSGDVLVRFDSNAHELNNALIVVTRSPDDGEEPSNDNEKFWFAMLERADEKRLSGGLRIKRGELSHRSEFTVRVVPIRESSMSRAENDEKTATSRSLVRKLPAHLTAMAQRVSAVLRVFLFGVDGNVARADAGRRRASRLPGVTWIQEGIEVTIAAATGAGKKLEVELAFGSSPGREPRAISWANPKTLSGDGIVVNRFDIHQAGDGRYLVDIKRLDLETRLAAISKAKNERNDEKVIFLAPLVEFNESVQ